MKCVNHVDKESIGMCINCGKNICEVCEVKVKGEMYCKECASKQLSGDKKPEKQPVLSAILSFALPGAGQVYNGQIGKGLLIFFTGWLIIPWIYGIFDGYKTAEKINSEAISVEQRPGCAIMAFVFMMVTPIIVAVLAIMAAIAIPAFMAAKAKQPSSDSAAVYYIK